MGRYNMICQNCGIEAPTKNVTFHQNIGALVMRFSRTASGQFCKACVHRTFWSYSAITLFLGPWGVISFVLSPIFLILNLVQYLTCLGMPPVPVGATVPALDEAAAQRIQPYTESMFQRLNGGEEFERVVDDVAMRSGTSPGQVVLYIQALIAASQSQAQQ